MFTKTHRAFLRGFLTEAHSYAWGFDPSFILSEEAPAFGL